jgi:hypothetical protein
MKRFIGQALLVESAHTKLSNVLYEQVKITRFLTFCPYVGTKNKERKDENWRRRKERKKEREGKREGKGKVKER